MTDTAKPWVLIRKGKPVLREATLEEAKRVHDMQRRNGAADTSAVIYGPEGKEFRCDRYRWSQWIEIFGDRRSARPVEAEEPADG